MIDYYPKINLFEEKDENDFSTFIKLTTNLRLKHKEGFYYLVKVSHVQNFNKELLDNTPLLLIMHNVYQSLLVEVEKTKNNYRYQESKELRHLNPIDKYQGEIDNYDPKYVFQFYDPSWSIDELLEVNTYMQNVLII